MTQGLFDNKGRTFICHDSEDKGTLVEELALKLRNKGLEIFYDDFSIQEGESIEIAVERNLMDAKGGIVIFSPDFIRQRDQNKREWHKQEFLALVYKEEKEGSFIIPVFYNIEPEKIPETFKGPLKNKKGFKFKTNDDTKFLADKIYKRIVEIQREKQGQRRRKKVLNAFIIICVALGIAVFIHEFNKPKIPILTPITNRLDTTEINQGSQQIGPPKSSEHTGTDKKNGIIGDNSNKTGLLIPKPVSNGSVIDTIQTHKEHRDNKPEEAGEYAERQKNPLSPLIFIFQVKYKLSNDLIINNVHRDSVLNFIYPSRVKEYKKIIKRSPIKTSLYGLEIKENWKIFKKDFDDNYDFDFYFYEDSTLQNEVVNYCGSPMIRPNNCCSKESGISYHVRDSSLIRTIVFTCDKMIYNPSQINSLEELINRTYLKTYCYQYGEMEYQISLADESSFIKSKYHANKIKIIDISIKPYFKIIYGKDFVYSKDIIYRNIRSKDIFSIDHITKDTSLFGTSMIMEIGER